MKVFRYIFAVSIITFSALVYVHQQIESVKLSYEIGCKEKKLKELIDRKDILRYNISNLESPSRLEHALSSKKVAVAYPKKEQIIMLTRTPSFIRDERILTISGLTERAGLFKLLDFLGGRAEAHARENNP